MQASQKVKLVMIDRRGDFPLQDGLGKAVTLQGGISPGPGCFVRQRRVIIEGKCWRIDAGPGPGPRRTLLAVIWIVDHQDLPRS